MAQHGTATSILRNVDRLIDQRINRVTNTFLFAATSSSSMVRRRTFKNPALLLVAAFSPKLAAL
jgi:hypothetical protein